METPASGIVFDIHRFSLNDGPGIRTTVFLKGCPLKCLWCHNPESQLFQPQLSFNEEKCLHCFNCVPACPNGVHQIHNNKHLVIWDHCLLSGECVTACPNDVLKIIGYQSTVNEIIAEVKKDLSYYKNSGGGITISGGEPLAQFQFTKELLISSKEADIHTCVDTCGQAAQNHFHEILPYTDLFLFDYKTTNPHQHKYLTGTDNRLILSNLDYLYNNGASIIVRCPLIPGINDNEAHLHSIAHLKNKYPKLKAIEILPYHSMGRNKSYQIGNEYKLFNVPDCTEEQIRYWNSFIKT